MVCKRCDRFFECNVEDINHCQCFNIPVTPATTAFLKKTSWGCLCSDCLKDINNKIIDLADEKFPSPGNLREGRDYYIENTFFVFTERYHMLRGSCCKSGCRHCPYGFGKV